MGARGRLALDRGTKSEQRETEEVLEEQEVALS
eukprot:COSAG03_NODE_13810_length_487_cov_1.703608_2_plen_32_part_01